MKNVNAQVWSHAIAAAILLIVIQLVGYLMGPRTMVSPMMSVVQGALVLLAMVFAGLAVRKAEGGFMVFGRMFGHLMIATAVVLLGSGLFSIVLFEWIAPAAFVDQMVRITLDKTLEMMSSFGTPESMVEDLQVQLEEDLRSGFSASGLLQGLMWNLAVWAVPALIVAAVLKRKPDNEFA